MGTFRVKSSLMNYRYGYNEIFNQNNDITTTKLKGSGISLGADWKAKVKNMTLDATGEMTPGNSRLSGTHLNEIFPLKRTVFFR